MFLGYSVLGYDSDLLYAQKLKRKKYSTTVYQGNAILDNVHCLNREMTLEEMENTPPVKQLWQESVTNWLSNYEDKLDGGNIPNNDIPMTGWRLKRKRKDEATYTPLKNFPLTTIQFEDWTAGNNAEYEYSVHAVSDTIESEGTIGTGTLDFEGWNLTDGTDNFMFWINLKTSDIPIVEDIVINDNYTEYPTFSVGKRKYEKSRIESMPMTYDGKDYVSTLEDLENLKKFIHNGKIKLLKNPKGELWWVFTQNFSHTYIDGAIGTPYTISFDWIQCGDGKNPFVGGAL